MRDDVPAALPLIAFALALALEPSLVNPYPFAAGMIAVAMLSLDRRAAIVAVFVALGTLRAAQHESQQAQERAVFVSLNPGRFAALEAPLERDWSVRPHVYVLRTSRFAVNGHAIDAPLSVYARFQPPQIEMESHVRIEGHLRRDERGWYSVAVKSERLLSYAGSLSPASPAAWNRRIANRLRRFAARRHAEIAMIEALVLGRGERLDEETRDHFKRGGTYHLLVFSGLQISLAAAAIAMLLRWIGAPRASDWSLLAFAIVAPLFIGPGASVSRASIGIGLYAVSRIAWRPTTFENLWCVAALLRLAIAPGDLTEPAFHLTYAGAGALLFIGKPLARSSLRLLAYIVAAEIAIAPLTLFHFHQYALGGSLLTIVMTPIVLVMLLFGAAFAATELTILLDAIAVLNAVCVKLNTIAAPASGFFAAPPLASVVAGFTAAVGAIALLRGPRRTIAIVIALLIPVAANFVTFAGRRSVEVPTITLFDVGQGDAIVLRSQDRTILIDGGGRHDDPRFGEMTLLPLLLDRGVRTIDTVILTHSHPDHCGGLVAAIRHLRVRAVLVSPTRFRGDCAQRILEAARTTSTPVRLARGGETAGIPDVRATTIVLRRAFKKSPENNGSIVLHVEAAGRTALLTGDVEHEAERVLSPMLSNIDVLKIPHHGSRTSSSAALLDATKPRIALISCGLNNFFGHPHPAVLSSLKERRIRVWRTDRNGTIEIRFEEGRIAVRPEIDTPR